MTTLVVMVKWSRVVKVVPQQLWACCMFIIDNRGQESQIPG